MGYLDLLLTNVGLGLQTALLPTNLLFCAIGVLVGMFVGVLPGIGAMSAMSMLFPLVMQVDANAALIMLAGIWYGTSYGGSTASILLNLPGSASSAVTCLDGYPMAQQGRAGIALFLTTAASFMGATVGILAMMLFAPAFAGYALRFGPAEYFTLMVFGLVASSTIAENTMAKSLAMVVAGIILGTVGLDMYTGVDRLTLGYLQLSDGLSIVALAMGIFGLSEVIISIRPLTGPASAKPGAMRITFRSMLPSREDMRRFWPSSTRGTLVGSFIGALPGTGSTIAAFIAYALEKRVTATPERFGHGAVEGVVAPEAANNAADQTAFIPTLTLGIPGSATMAIMLGALLVHGINPGPRLMTDRPDLFWGLIMSFWIGNVILVILNIPLIGIWVRLLTIPYALLYPVIVIFVCIGVFSINYSVFDVWIVVIFGFVGYFMRLTGLPAAPLLLGFVLGPLMEEHFRRAMILSRGDFGVFFGGPLSRSFIALTLLLLLFNGWATFRARRRRRGVHAVQDGAGT